MHRPSRKLPRTVLAGLLTLAGGALTPALAAADPPQAGGYVYVDDNSAGTNTIAAFARHDDGTLTALPGSPFGAGGAGTGSGVASQGAIQISSDGRFVLAVDAGSNQVSVLRIKHDGS